MAPAGTSTSLTSRINEMAIHTHTHTHLINTHTHTVRSVAFGRVMTMTMTVTYGEKRPEGARHIFCQLQPIDTEQSKFLADKHQLRRAQKLTVA